MVWVVGAVLVDLGAVWVVVDLEVEVCVVELDGADAVDVCVEGALGADVLVLLVVGLGVDASAATGMLIRRAAPKAALHRTMCNVVSSLRLFLIAEATAMPASVTSAMQWTNSAH